MHYISICIEDKIDQVFKRSVFRRDQARRSLQSRWPNWPPRGYAVMATEFVFDLLAGAALSKPLDIIDTRALTRLININFVIFS